MNCSRHPHEEAVAQCASCGAYICSKCADATKDGKEYFGSLCVDCYKEKLAETAEYYKKDKSKRLTRMIVSTILYVIGMVGIIVGLMEEPMMAVVGVILCGVYTGLTWRKAAKENHEQYEREHGVEYVITDNGIERKDGFWSKLIFFFIGTVFGVIVTPIRFVTDMIGMSKDKKNVKSLYAEIAELNAI